MIKPRFKFFQLGSRQSWRRRLTRLRLFILPTPDQLSWPVVLKLSTKNLLTNRSRTLITIGGMGAGVGAIVFLLSFAYALQAVVVNRMLWPEALRSADVTSDSSQVKLDRDMLVKIKNIEGVSQVYPVVRLAGRIKYKDSQVDIVVIGSSQRYVQLSNIPVIYGRNLSAQSSLPYKDGRKIDLLSQLEVSAAGQVAGAETVTRVIDDGDLVSNKDVKYKVKGGSYVPVYAWPNQRSKIIGFLAADMLQTYQAKLVWGGVYEAVGGQGRQILDNGQIKGKWLKTYVPIWRKIDNLIFEPVLKENGQQLKQWGYLTLVDIYLMSNLDDKIDDLMSTGQVLGESTSGSSLEKTEKTADQIDADSVVSSGTQAAQLIDVLTTTKDQASTKKEQVQLKVKIKTKPENRELLVNEVLIRAWDSKPEDVIGQTVKLSYVITSSLVPSINGRVLSDEVEYKIVGVVKGGKKALIYAPLADIESMGIGYYSLVKVLVDKEENLPFVRDVIRSLGLTSFSLSDTLGQINRLFQVMRFLLIAFGSIALLIALFGMFNTLTVSLMERTREIGIMKSLGTTNLDVWRLFITESLIISLSGAVLGVVLGTTAEVMLDKFLLHFSQKAGFGIWLLPPDLIVIIILVTIVVGLVTGWYPARRAAKISALDAIRYE